MRVLLVRLRTLLPLIACWGCGEKPGDTSEPIPGDSEPCTPEIWYTDADGDGWGDADAVTEACAAPPDSAAVPGDCDDHDDACYPGAREVPYDGVDQDCDGADLTDQDGDGLAAQEVGGSDCDDRDPGTGEAQSWYADQDGDGWGDPLRSATVCEPKPGWVLDDQDCDDRNAAAHPGAEESICDGVDSDCDGDGEDVVAAIEGLEYRRLQQAIDEADDGAAILVCPGSWPVAELRIARTGATLRLGSWSGNPDDTELTGQDSSPIIHAQGPETLAIENLTLSHGKAAPMTGCQWGPSGGAILAQDVALTLRNVVFSKNSAQSYGGAIAFEGSSPHDLSIADCLFEGNEAGYDGGALCTAPEGGDVLAVAIADSTFEGNSVTGPASTGAAALIHATEVALKGVRVQRSGATLAILEVYARDDLQVEIDGSSFVDNTAGTGALTVSAATLSFEMGRTDFASNTCGDAGALTLATTDLEASIEDSVFVDNRCASSCGGALDVSFGHGGLDITDSSFTDNYNGINGAGALQVDASRGSVVLADSVFMDNDGELGALLIDGSGAADALLTTLDNAVVVRNRSHGGLSHAGGLTAYTSSVESLASDWGTDPFDNEPSDVWSCDQDFGAAASFSFVADSGEGCVER